MPHTHASWLIEHVPGAQGHIVAGEGHVSLRARMPEILADLLVLAGHPGR